MNILELRIKHLYSHIDTIIPFNKDGFYFIYGINVQTKERNGIGKSAIIEAIKYVLYGTVRTKSIDEVISFGETIAEIGITFEFKGDIYVVTRIRKKNSSTKVTIYKNNKDLEIITIKDCNKFIEKLLGLNYEQFMHSFLFGQNEFDNLQSFTTTKLIEFLKTMLNLERFDNYKERAQTYLNKVTDEINQLLGMKEVVSKLSSVNHSKKELQDNLNKIRTKCSNQEKLYTETKKKVDGLFSKLKPIERELASATYRKNQLESNMTYIGKENKCPMCKQLLINNVELKREQQKELKEVIQKVGGLFLEVENCKSEYEQENKIKEDLTQLLNGLSTKLGETNQQLKVLIECEGLDVEQIEIKYKELSEKKVMLEEAVKIFSNKGLPLYYLTKSIPKLENVINNTLSQLSEFRIKIKTQGLQKSTLRLTNMCEIKIFRGINEYSLQQLSGGQERLVNFAFRIGIAKIFSEKSKFDTLFLDEIFGALGEVNRENLVAQIKTLKKNFKKILIISHLDEIKDYFKDEANNIFIEFDKGVSRIVYNNSREENINEVDQR